MRQVGLAGVARGVMWCPQVSPASSLSRSALVSRGRAPDASGDGERESESEWRVMLPSQCCSRGFLPKIRTRTTCTQSFQDQYEAKTGGETMFLLGETFH